MYSASRATEDVPCNEAFLGPEDHVPVDFVVVNCVASWPLDNLYVESVSELGELAIVPDP